MPPTHLSPCAKPPAGRHLSFEEREDIAQMWAQGFPPIVYGFDCASSRMAGKRGGRTPVPIVGALAASSRRAAPG